MQFSIFLHTKVRKSGQNRLSDIVNCNKFNKTTKQHELYNVQCWNIIHITYTHTFFLRYLICDICDKYHVYEYLWQVSGMGKNLQELWIAFQVSKPAGQMSLSSILFCYNTDQQFRFMISILLDKITRFNCISEIFELYVLFLHF